MTRSTGRRYIYFVDICNTAEELFYITRCTNLGISCLMCVVIQKSSLIQGASDGVYLPECA